MYLKGKKIFISAAGAGMGFSVAKIALNAGAEVYATDLEPTGLQKLSAGKIKLRDTILASDEINIEPENRNIALSFQDNSLFPNYKVIDNINYGEKRSNGTRSKIDALNQI